MEVRDQRGRFSKPKVKVPRRKRTRPIFLDHGYFSSGKKDHTANETEECLPKSVDKELWKSGRFLVEFGVLLERLKCCTECRLGPVPLTFSTITGTLKKGLSGFLYVKCQNPDCGHINVAPYGKTHRIKSGKGMACFTANTKLGVEVSHRPGRAEEDEEDRESSVRSTLARTSLSRMLKRFPCKNWTYSHLRTHSTQHRTD